MPKDRLLSLLFCLLLNSLVYWGAQQVTAGWTMLDLTTPLDAAIPVVPAWSYVYVGAYLFWAAGYVLMARGQNWYQVMTAEVLAKLVCGVCFVLLPTTNVRPLLPDGAPGAWLLHLIYAADAPANLLPSIHCLESWLCFAGLRGRRDVPLWYRVFSLVFALMVCASTVLIRQHVLVDVAAGVLLAEGMLLLSRKRNMGSRLSRWMNRLCR